MMSSYCSDTTTLLCAPWASSNRLMMPGTARPNAKKMRRFAWVMHMDVRHYFANIDQHCLRAQLKRRFGLGYHLKAKLVEGGTREALEKLVAKHVDKEHYRRLDDSVLTFVFDLDVDMQQLTHLLLELDQAKATFGVEHYSLNQTSLEEIFMDLMK